MRSCVVVAFLAVVLADSAQAYVGPGLGLGAVGAFFGILFAVFLAVVGVFWYPLKRFFRARKVEPLPEEDGDTSADDSGDPKADAS